MKEINKNQNIGIGLTECHVEDWTLAEQIYLSFLSCENQIHFALKKHSETLRDTNKQDW